MTLEQKKLTACAKLDGWIKTPANDTWKRNFWIEPETRVLRVDSELPPYATSLDATVPVVVKWVDNDIENADKFFNELAKILPIKEGSYNILACWLLWTAKPSQIHDALLLAAGKMPEGGG